MTVAPRADGLRRELARDVGAGREERDVDARRTPRGDGLADSWVWPSIATVRPADRPGREQAQLPDGELALVEDLDHRPADDAGGADDRDGEGGSVSCRAWLRG